MVGKRSFYLILATGSVWVAPALGQMRITEYMYNGLGAGNIGEFVEFTNVGTTPINMTGWSFDDNSRAPGSQSLSAFGTVAPGQSVILTDNTAAAFRTAWGLSASVVVIGGNANNLGRADEINLYDNTNTLVDRLTYDDQTLGGPRANGVSAWVCNEYLGANNSSQLRISISGDVQGSHSSTVNELGSPGTHTFVLCLCGNGTVDASVGEQCDGGTCCTSTCQFVASGTSCRGSAGACDPAESCTGNSAACPADVLTAAGTPCRPSAGACDPAESCTGNSALCPADILAAAGTPCRPSAGDCDPAESCTGNSAACPADVLTAVGTPCRASAGACDPAEACTGNSPTCPADLLSAAGTECRASAGDCDPAESCDGSTPNCPANQLDPAGTECRASTGPCDPAESCNGAQAACPPDGHTTVCTHNDGCCPVGCNANSDNDCPAVCGNVITEPGEECDGTSAANCPSGTCNLDCTCFVQAVPTVSEWGLAGLTLIGLTAGTILFGRSRAART